MKKFAVVCLIMAACSSAIAGRELPVVTKTYVPVPALNVYPVQERTLFQKLKLYVYNRGNDVVNVACCVTDTALATGDTVVGVVGFDPLNNDQK